MSSLKHTYIFAHRGASALYPENSLAAFKKGFQLCGRVELDVQLSLDRELMVFHDDTLERMTKKTGPLSDYSSEMLRSTPLLNSTQTIPTLSEVMTLYQSLLPELPTTTQLNIELKGPQTAQPVFECLQKETKNHRFSATHFLISSFSRSELLHFHQLEKTHNLYFPKAVLMDTDHPQTPLTDHLQNHISLGKTLGAEALHIGTIHANLDIISKIRQSGFKVRVFTINDKFESIFELGLDGFFTDVPDVAIAFFGEDS